MSSLFKEALGDILNGTDPVQPEATGAPADDPSGDTAGEPGEHPPGAPDGGGVDGGDPAPQVPAAEPEEGGGDSKVPADGEPAGEPAQLAELADEHQLKLLVDGEERAISWGELKKKAQVLLTADRRLQEVQEMKKRSAEEAKSTLDQVMQKGREIYKTFRERPFDTYLAMLEREHGSRSKAEEVFKQDVLSYMKPYIDEDAMPEADRARRQAERELKDAREETARLKQDRERQIMDVRKAEARTQIDHSIATAIKDSGLPAQPWMVQEMARRLYHAMNAGTPLTPTQAAVNIKADLPGLVAAMVGSLPIGEIRERAPGLIEALRKADLAEVKEKTRASSTKPRTQAAPGARRAADRDAHDRTMGDFRRRLQKSLE